MTLSFMNNKGYIFIVRRLGKQSKLILSRLDSISNLKLNLRIHGQCGPYAHAGADLQAFLIFRFKPILISAHKLTLLIYGDNNGATSIFWILFFTFSSCKTLYFATPFYHGFFLSQAHSQNVVLCTAHSTL